MSPRIAGGTFGTVFVLPKEPGKDVPKDLRQILDSRVPMVPVYRKEQWTTGVPDFYITRSTNIDEHVRAANLGIRWIVDIRSAAEWLTREITRLLPHQNVYVYQGQKDGRVYPMVALRDDEWHDPADCDVETLPLWEPDPDTQGVCDHCGTLTNHPDNRMCARCEAKL